MTNHSSAAPTIIVCTRCRGGQAAEQKGGALLRERLEVIRSDRTSPSFEVADARCMAGCERPLVIAVSAPGKASYLFGDIDPHRDAPHLIDFVRFYHSLPDGWCRESERSEGLIGKTLARIPMVPAPRDVP